MRTLSAHNGLTLRRSEGRECDVRRRSVSNANSAFHSAFENRPRRDPRHVPAALAERPLRDQTWDLRRDERNGRDAPIPAVRRAMAGPLESTLSRHSGSVKACSTRHCATRRRTARDRERRVISDPGDVHRCVAGGVFERSGDGGVCLPSATLMINRLPSPAAASRCWPVWARRMI